MLTGLGAASPAAGRRSGEPAILATIVFLAILLAILLGSLWRPGVALGGILCTYVLEQWVQTHAGFFYAFGRFTNWALGLICLAAVVNAGLRGRLRLRNYPAVGVVVLVLYGFSALSLSWTIGHPFGTEQWMKFAPYVAAFVLLAPLTICEPADLRRAMLTLLALGTLTLVLISATTEWAGRGVRILTSGAGIGNIDSGLEGNPLALASLAGWVAMLAVLMNFRGLARFWQVVRWGVVFLGMALTIRSGSRGQLMAALVATIVCLPMSRRIRNVRGFAAVSIGLVLLLGISWWAFENFALFAERFTVDNMMADYESGRVQTSLLVLEQWFRAGPLAWALGLGVSASFVFLDAYPHVVPIEVLVEQGVIGMGLLLLVPILVFRSARRAWPAVRDFPEARGLLAAGVGLFLFETILSFKQGSLLGSTDVFTFAIVVGLFERTVSYRVAQAQALQELMPTSDLTAAWPQGTVPANA